MQSEYQTRTALVETWLQRHVWGIVVLLIAVGFVLRLQPAVPMYLNPDEAYNYHVVNQPRLVEALRQATTDNPHPPLYYALLYLWHKAGDSDVWLRLLSVLAGTAGLIAVWLWLRRAFNTTTALAGVFFLTFATEAINLSAELRDYAVLVCLLGFSLYCLERSLQERSALMMALSCMLSLLAILDDFSAVWLVAGMSSYALVRLTVGSERQSPVLDSGEAGREPRPAMRRMVFTTWLTGQVAIAAVTFVLYRVSVAELRGSPFEQWAKDIMLRGSYYHAGDGSPVAFLGRAVFGVFHYVFSSKPAAWAGLLLFLAALVIVVVRGGNAGAGRRNVALLLGMPFALVGIAAAAGAYPFGPTRHSYFLILPVVAGVGFAASELAGKRLWLMLLLLFALVLPLWKVIGRPPGHWYRWRRMFRTDLASAIDYLRVRAPRGGVVFSDTQTQLVLRRYMRVGTERPVVPRPPGFSEYECDGLRLVAMTAWSPSADSFMKMYRLMVDAYGLKSGETAWVASAGWGENLASRIAGELDSGLPGAAVFSRSVAVFPARVGSSLVPMEEALREEATKRRIEQLASAGAGLLNGRFKWVFWPSYYLPDSTFARRFPASVLAYSDLYRQLRAGHPLDDFLPALALWLSGTHEVHTTGMRYMAGFENFAVEQYVFTLAVVDTNSAVGVYLVQALRSPANGQE